MAGGGDVEDGGLLTSLTDDVEHAGDEEAGIEGDGFAWFEVNLDVGVALAELAQDADEACDVVAGFGDVVAAAHVDPFDAFEEFREAFFDGVDDAFEDVGILLAEGVEVETFQAVEVGVIRFDLNIAGAEAATGGAGVVEGDFDSGEFWVNA